MTTTGSASFLDQQRAFTAHLRDPVRVPAPADVEERRIRIYRDLVVNNLSSLLASHFPVLHRLMATDRWRALVGDFLRGHRAVSPLFPELPREFLEFLGQRCNAPLDPPFLLELAHYEWIEMVLLISDADPPPAGLKPDGDLLEQHPVLSSLAWNFSYRFPVHQIGPEQQPREAPEQPTHLLVYLDSGERVRFMEINAVTQRLLVLLRQEPSLNGRAVLGRIALELGHPESRQLIDFGAELLSEWRGRGVIIGACDPNASQSSDR